MDEFITIDEFINTRYQIQIDTINTCVIKNVGYRNVNYSMLVKEFKMDKYDCQIISHTLDECQLLDDKYNCISILILLKDTLFASLEFVFIPTKGKYELNFLINDDKHKLDLPNNFNNTNIVDIMIEHLADEKIVLMLFQ
jgi:hypothetical protein